MRGIRRRHMVCSRVRFWYCRFVRNWLNKDRFTSVPEDTCNDEHGKSENGANHCAAAIGYFSLLLLDGQLLRQDNFLVKHCWAINIFSININSIKIHINFISPQQPLVSSVFNHLCMNEQRLDTLIKSR